MSNKLFSKSALKDYDEKFTLLYCEKECFDKIMSIC